MKAKRNGIEICLAKKSDALIVWPWRNSESTRKFFRNNVPIDPEEHKLWWDKAIDNQEISLLIGLWAGKSVGVIRFDYNNNMAIASIYVDPNLTGQGIGSGLLSAGIDWLKENKAHVVCVEAEVHPDNHRSISIFKKNSFIEKFITFKLNLYDKE